MDRRISTDKKTGACPRKMGTRRGLLLVESEMAAEPVPQPGTIAGQAEQPGTAVQTTLHGRVLTGELKASWIAIAHGSTAIPRGYALTFPVRISPVWTCAASICEWPC